MIMTCGTTVQDIQCKRKVRICAEFSSSWADLCWFSSVLIFADFFFFSCRYLTFSTWELCCRGTSNFLHAPGVLCSTFLNSFGKIWGKMRCWGRAISFFVGTWRPVALAWVRRRRHMAKAWQRPRGPRSRHVRAFRRVNEITIIKPNVIHYLIDQ